MKVYETPHIRNLVLAGHNASGKTTLTSSFLFASGKVNRLLTVDDGNAPTDFDENEVERKISIQSAVAFCEYKNHKFNLIDTPGYAIFFAETSSAMRAGDVAGIVVNAVNGLEIQTDKAVKLARENGLPIFFIINKVDKEHADPLAVLQKLQDKYGNGVIPLNLPIGKESSFAGVADVLSKKAFLGEHGKAVVTEGDVPGEISESLNSSREALVEKIAESNEALMERYFEEGDLPEDDILKGLREGILKGDIMPVVFTSAYQILGIHTLMDHLITFAPDPTHRTYRGVNPVSGEDKDPSGTSLYVFKTISDPFAGRINIFRVITGALKSDAQLLNPRTENIERFGAINFLDGKTPTSVSDAHQGDIGSVMKLKETLTGDTLCEKSNPVKCPPVVFPEAAISFAVEPKSKGDEDKIAAALLRICEEDPVLHVSRDLQTKEQILSGTGQLHIEIVVAKLKKRYGVEVNLKPPKVPYKETITKKAETTYRHKKQTGGRGQFAECAFIVEPQPRGEGYQFVDKIFGGSISHSYRPAVDKGIQEAAAKGFLAGYPVIDFKVTLIDGKEHPVDSSEMAFKIAGSMGFKQACDRAGATILEPIMNMDVFTPEDYMGDVMGDLNGRRGRVSGMDIEGDVRVIHVQVPLAEVLSYASDLRSFTQGQGSFHMEFSHYEEAPKQVQDKIIAEARREKEEED